MEGFLFGLSLLQTKNEQLMGFGFGFGFDRRFDFYSEKGMVHLKKKIEQKEIIERNKRKNKEI